MIIVLSPGARTLVQDAGRSGFEHLGVPTSGAADPTSLHLANRLVGNDAAEAAFEVAAFGPTFEFTTDATLAYAGADTDLFIDDRPVPCHHTLRVRAGQVLRVGTLRGGLFGYLAVGGGLDVERVLGSASSCTMSGLGPAPLTGGQHICLRNASHLSEDAFAAPISLTTTPGIGTGGNMRVLPGPHSHLFSEDAMEAFLSSRWTVSPLSSRVGVRLADAAPIAVENVSLPSMGMVRGAIQVPPNGMPIVLGPDHGTVGGYPVLGVVHPDDMASLMQRPSGSPVTFTLTGAGTPTTVAPTLPTVLLHRQMAAASA